MLASCLHPYKDSRGRYYASVLPFLVRQFPRDQEVEVLRSNLVRAGVGRHGGGGMWDGSGVEGLEISGEGEGEDAGMGGEEEVVVGGSLNGDGEGKRDGSGGGGWGVEMDVDAAPAAAAESVNPFATVTTTAQDEQVPPLKRKSEVFEPETGKPTKRVDVKKAAEVQVAVMPKVKPVEGKAVDESGDESDSEGSVQIDMTLDDEEDEEEEDEDE
jgi:hypothetical protein